MTNLRNIVVPVTEFSQNARILWDESAPGEAVVVDPGGEAEKIYKVIQENGLKVAQIWLTHSHLDHCGGVADLKELTQAPLYGNPLEQLMRSKVIEICQMYGLPAGDMKNCPEPDKELVGGESLKIGSYEFKVLFTPGHSPGHVCMYCEAESLLIAGDTVFQNSIGRTDLPGGDHDTLLRSIKNEILVLPDDTVIAPGHGGDTTVGHESKGNPFL